MLFSKSKRLENPSIPLLIDTYPIQRVKEFKFLGYMIDENLKWNSHIQYICGKVGKMLGILTKLQKSLNTNTLLTLYFTFIHTYSRTSLLRTPGDFADLYVVSIGRCNHGPLNQIRYTKFTQTNFIKKTETGIDIIDYI